MNIRFERSHDYDVITTILCEAPVYRRMVNDDAPEPEQFTARPIPGISYILCSVENSTVAVFLLDSRDQAPGVCEVHFAMLPWVWGMTAEIARQFVGWVWRETSLYRLIGPMPSYNRLAFRLARWVGFQRYEVRPSAGMRNGVSFDLIMLEMKRPQKREAAA